MYINPHEIISKVCRTCGNTFDSPRYYNKEYCNPRCRRASKHRRETVRTQESALANGDLTKLDSRFFAQVTNPTETQLGKYAELILEGLTHDKPIQFFGNIPYWTSPSGIVLAEQFGVEPKQWIMQRAEPANDLAGIDALLGKV